MITIIKNRISVKVALLVNVILFTVISAGTMYLISMQSKSLEMQLAERGKILSIVGAKSICKVLEEAVDNGVFTVTDAFDTDYIKIPGFDPPKYHTKYDFYLDKSILALEDEFLKDKSVVFAVAVDINGYLPTHNTRFQQPPTGDKEKDLVGNRTKRIFSDKVGIKAAKNKDEGFLQIYHRDTGEKMWDISSPIFLKGKHWGGFRIGFSLDVVEQAKKELRNSLIVIMSIVLLISIISIFVVVDISLRPLGMFTRIASDLADGKVDKKIETNSSDEIGQLASVLERLRISLQTAFERLKQK